MTDKELQALLAAAKGPWRLRKLEGDWGASAEVLDADGRTICDDVEYYPTQVDPERMPLIAAAPDLARELLTTRAALAESQAKHQGAERVCDLLDNQRVAALARATAAEAARDAETRRADAAQADAEEWARKCAQADDHTEAAEAALATARAEGRREGLEAAAKAAINADRGFHDGISADWHPYDAEALRRVIRDDIRALIGGGNV